MPDLEAFLRATATNSEAAFRNQKRILSFAEYLEAFSAAPARLGRNAAQYLLDAFDHFGTLEVPGIGGPVETSHAEPAGCRYTEALELS